MPGGENPLSLPKKKKSRPDPSTLPQPGSPEFFRSLAMGAGAPFYSLPSDPAPDPGPEPGSLDFFRGLVRSVSGIDIKPKTGGGSGTGSTTQPASNATSNSTSNTSSNTSTSVKKSPYYTPGLKRWDEVMKEKFGTPKAMKAGGLVEGRGAGKAVKGRGRGRIV